MVVLVLVVLLAAVWLGQRWLVYYPDRSTPAAAGSLEEVTLTTSDGLRLKAWYARPTGPDRDVTVFVAPGNGGNRAGRVPLAQALAAAGFAVLLLEYRGYGGNPGSPSEAGLARDARAGLDYLVHGRGVPTDRIIYFGESLGTGVVTELAIERPPAGLLLRSPYTDLAAVGAAHYPYLPVRAILWDRFPVAEHVARIEVPVAVVYGSRDTIVPPEQSREVAARAAGEVQVTVVSGANHNDPDLACGPQLVAAVVALAESVRS